MVSNIDLLRKSSRSLSEESQDPSSETSRDAPAGSTERSTRSARGQSKLSHSNSSENDAFDNVDSEGSAMDGILTRLMDHIETTDRRNNDALDALNDRLDQLSHIVQTSSDQDDQSSVQNSDFQEQVSDMSRHVATAREAQTQKSARAVFEEKLTRLSERLQRTESDGVPNDIFDDESDQSRLAAIHSDKPGERHDEFSHSEEPAGEDDEFEYLADDRRTIENDGDDVAPPITNIVLPSQPQVIDEIARTFDDEITSASLSHDSLAPISKQPARNDERLRSKSKARKTRGETPLQSSADNKALYETYSNEADAMEALAIGFEEQDLSPPAFTPQRHGQTTTKAEQQAVPLDTSFNAASLDLPAPPVTTNEIGPRLDTLVNKFENVMSARHTEPLLRTIESQIAELPAYFDREENRQHRLEIIEGNISKLTSMIQDTRSAITELSERIAEETANHVVNKLDWGTSADRLAAIDDYLRNLKQEEDNQQYQSDQTLEAVYGALEQMIDRLESIELSPAQDQATLSDERFSHATPTSRTVAETVLADDRYAGAPQNTETSSKFPTEESDESLSIPRFEKSAPSKRSERNIANDFDETNEKVPPQLAARSAAFLDEEDDDHDEDNEELDEVRELEDFGAHTRRRSLDNKSKNSDAWDHHVPPYIANQSRESRTRPTSWVSGHKTALVAAVMVFLSATGGLLLSQMSLFDNGAISQTDSTQLASRKLFPYPKSDGVDQTTTSAIGQLPNFETRPQVAPQTQYAPVDSPVPQETTNTSPQALPGVAIGHVSEPGVRHQLHQSLRHKELAELSGKDPESISARFPSVPTTQKSYGRLPTGALPAKVDSAQSLGQPAPSTSAAHKQLPPPEIGPMSLRVAAANGDPKAVYEIGARYARGSGVGQDLVEATRWFNKAASSGYAPAQYRLATHYERGAGVSKDLDRAKIWYRRAAESGNVKAMHNFAVLHTGREGMKPDYPTAALWFQQAANRGLSDSQYNLAVLYENGLGVPKNLIESYKWLTLASLSGDREAGKRREFLRKQLEPSAIAAAEKAAIDWKPQPALPSANAEQFGNLGTVTNTAALSPTSKQPAKSAAPSLVPPPVRSPVFVAKQTGSSATTFSQPHGQIQDTRPSPQASQTTAANSAPNPLIRTAQELLSKLGYDTGPADGQSGPKTRSAITAFQRRAGMPETGEVTIDLIQRLSSLSI